MRIGRKWWLQPEPIPASPRQPVTSQPAAAGCSSTVNTPHLRIAEAFDVSLRPESVRAVHRFPPRTDRDMQHGHPPAGRQLRDPDGVRDASGVAARVQRTGSGGRAAGSPLQQTARAGDEQSGAQAPLPVARCRTAIFCIECRRLRGSRSPTSSAPAGQSYLLNSLAEGPWGRIVRNPRTASHPHLATAAEIRRDGYRRFNGANGIRTRDLLRAKQALSQLSYGPAHGRLPATTIPARRHFGSGRRTPSPPTPGETEFPAGGRRRVLHEGHQSAIFASQFPLQRHGRSSGSWPREASGRGNHGPSRRRAAPTTRPLCDAPFDAARSPTNIVHGSRPRPRRIGPIRSHHAHYPGAVTGILGGFGKRSSTRGWAIHRGSAQRSP